MVSATALRSPAIRRSTSSSEMTDSDQPVGPVHNGEPSDGLLAHHLQGVAELAPPKDKHGARRHDVADAQLVRVAPLGDHPHGEVAIGDQALRFFVARDGDATDVLVARHFGGLGRAGVRWQHVGRPAHHLFDIHGIPLVGSKCGVVRHAF